MPNEITINGKEFKFSEILKSGYRGEQPEDIKIMCHQLCKDYLGGVWCEISEEKINIRRITGGLQNQLYYFGVSSDVKPIGSEPTEVAVRLYGKKSLPMQEECENERLVDTIVGMIVSENKLGPKIYGLFGNGEILKYYKNHQFQLEQQKQPELARELAQKLAKFHSLKVPIKKNNPLTDIMLRSYTKALELYPISQLMDEYNCETLKKVNLMQEIEWIHNLMKDTNSPIVFTHFDFRGSNILVMDSDANDYEPHSRIVLCDHEYAGYYNRGIDLSTISFEWGRPLDELANTTEFPDPSRFTPFLNAYIEESAKVYGKDYLRDSVNSVEHLIYEINVFILVRGLLFVFLLMRMDEEESKNDFIFSTKKQQLAFAEMSINAYIRLKDKFQVKMF